MSDDGGTVRFEIVNIPRSEPGAEQSEFSKLHTAAWDAVRGAWLAQMRMTPEVRAEARRARAAEVAPTQAAVLAAHAEVAADADGLRRAMLDLHGPRFRDLAATAHCEGCDEEGYEVDDTTFPCRTYEVARDFEASA